MELKIVDFSNYKKAIEIQNEIFPKEDGTLNILASIDRELFQKKTVIEYPDDNVKYYIAYENNEEIGITGIYCYDKTDAWLGWFGILSNYRKKGYGKELLLKTMNIAKEQGYKVLRLYTDKVENANAIKLYEKMGFIGEKYSAEELSYDCYIYSKSLYDEKIDLWNNKLLDLSYQSELDQITNEQAKEILKLYE